MSDKGNVLFYILIPVYKVEKYIEACINSVLTQDYGNFMVVIVDDGTPDRAGEICDAYAKKDMRVHVIHQENRGQIAARQKAIEYVHGQGFPDNSYMIFLDSDDTLKAGSLKRIAKVTEVHHYDMVIYGMDRVADGKVAIPYKNIASGSGLMRDKRELYRLVLFDANYNSLCRKAIRTELIPQKSFREYYGISLAEDLLQSLDYYRACQNVYILDESLYNYTINPNSITNSISAKNFRIDFTVRQLTYEFLCSENVFNEKDWADYRGFCIHLINNSISTVMGFDIPFDERKILLTQIRTSGYYMNCIEGKAYNCSFKDNIRYFLFRMKAYHALGLLETVWRSISGRI